MPYWTPVVIFAPFFVFCLQHRFFHRCHTRQIIFINMESHTIEQSLQTFMFWWVWSLCFTYETKCESSKKCCNYRRIMDFKKFAQTLRTFDSVSNYDRLTRNPSTSTCVSKRQLVLLFVYFFKVLHFCLSWFHSQLKL